MARRPSPDPGFQWVDVQPETFELLRARNRRDVGRGITAPFDNQDGTVAMHLSDDVVRRLRQLSQPPETLEATMRRVLWTTPKVKP